MPSLEQLVYDRLASEATITTLLPGVDGGDPAIFAEQAPDSTSRRWDDTAQQTPRIIITVERIQNAERGSDATLRIDLYGPADIIPTLSQYITSRLSNVYWHPDNEPPLATRARSSVSDLMLADRAQSEDALSLEFDILVFPSTLTLDPDPVAILQEWAANLDYSGYDEPVVQAEPGSWSSDDVQPPALYIRLMNERLLKRWPLKLQWNAEARLHVLHANATIRNTAARSLLHNLALTPMLRLGRGWLVIDRPLSFDSGADPLRQGQLSATVEYWTSKPPSGAQLITHVIFLRTDVGEEGQEIPAPLA